MHRMPRRSAGYGSELLNQLARDTQRNFDAILDVSTHKLTLVWDPPFAMNVPFFAGDPRLTSPDSVRCTTARNLTDPTILTVPGGCAWEWIGNNSVRVDEVGGLTAGQRYDLVFEVTG